MKAATQPGANGWSLRDAGGGLFRKYVLSFVGLISAVLMVNGAVNAWFSYQQEKRSALRLQSEMAEAAAQRTEEFVAEIERQIGWTTHAQWEAQPVDQSRFLLRQFPAITELIQLDGNGREQLKVSRLAMDVIGGGNDHSAEPPFTEAMARKKWFSPVYFRKESEPYMTMAFARAGRNAGVTVAEVNLKLIWDVVSTIKVGHDGYAYVVDRRGRLIAHPDISLVLRNTDMSELPQVAAAREQLAGGHASGSTAAIATDASGRSVLSAFAPIRRLGWSVFVELPLREALAPLYPIFLRTGILLAAGLALSAIAALLLARRMVEPIRKLEAGAARLGGGDLSHRLAIDTGDELERLAYGFNAMAERLQESHASLERKVADRTRELSELLQRQTATAEVLKVISRSAFDLQLVLDTLVESACRLCSADTALIFQRDGDVYRAIANHGYSRELLELVAAKPIPLGRGTIAGRTAIEGRTVHVPDVLVDPEYTGWEYQRRGGFRAMLGVPLLREGAPVGVMVLTRTTARPFSDKEIELITTFADQAVIAIENVRLFEEVKARTAELSEALERQTATSEVLQAISRSKFDLQVVLETLVQSAARLCAADIATITRQKAGTYYRAAVHGFPDDFAEEMKRIPVAAERGTMTGRALLEGRIVHIPDVLADPDYTWSEAQRVGGFRSLIGVPLLREGTPIGALTLGRRAVRPFDAKDVELITTFADQAVIAIENVRLFDEVQARTRELSESLEHQMATSQVLEVISRSPADLDPVFQAMLDSAVRICRARCGILFLHDNGVFRERALCNVPDAFAAFLRQRPAVPPDERLGLARLAATRRPVHIPDIMEEEVYRAGEPFRVATVDLAGARSWLGVPMLKGGGMIGAIAIYRQQVQPFSDKEIALVATFANQAVIAIENARLLVELRQRTAELARSVEELKALGETGQAVSGTLDLGTVIDTIASRAMALGEADGCVLFRYRRASGEFSMWRATGLAESHVAAMRKLRIRDTETSMGRAIRDRTPVTVADIAALPDWPLRQASLEAGNRSVLIVPLLHAERVLGTLVLVRRRPSEFAARTIEVMQTFANHSVLAIQNARLFREIEEKGRQLAIASEHKSQFLANMSHELRTPMNAVLGYTEMLLDGVYGEVTGEAHEILEYIQSNGEHLLALINDVLDLSKIEAGQLTLVLDEYVLPSVIEAVIAVAQPLARAKGLDLRVSLEDDLPVGRGDGRRLTQVLLNLVGNAIKFTDAGSVEIAAGAIGDVFALSVTDTGPGVDVADQERIFDAFQQVDNSSTREKGGTGLGLAISKRIVEMHGGLLAVQSVPGLGSTFRITFPIRVDQILEAA